MVHRLPQLMVVTNKKKHEIYRSVDSVREVVRLQFVENLVRKRVICYRGMDDVGESDRKHQ